MFDFVRNHSRLAQGLLVLLIFPSFVFFGIQGYSRFTDPNNVTVAKVDGQGISRAEWEQAVARRLDAMRQQMPNADPRLFDTPQFRHDTLEQMLRERVLLAAADDLKLYPEGARLNRLAASDPTVNQLRGSDGKISADMLAMRGMTPQMFDALMRQQYGVNQVLDGIVQSEFAPPAAAAPALDAVLQRRELQLQKFEPAAYRAKVAPTDAQIEAFYKAHESEFRASEQATIDYVVLSPETLAKGLQIADKDVRAFYDDEKNAARFTAPEERRASHILIKADAQSKDADRKAAKARAEELLQQVRKNPASFAEVARKNSQDPGSAAQGGDLDFFGRGMMTKPFEDAVFALKPGQISDVVESDFGYHVIMLTAVRGGVKKPFDAVRGEIEAELRKAQATKKFSELAESFSDTVYQQPDSLQPAIDKFKLEKQTATVQRTPAPGATGPLASSKLLDAVFAADSVRNKRNTDAVDVGASQLVAAHVTEYQPARTLALAEVKDKVHERVVGEQAAALARDEGTKRLAELRKSPAESLPETVTFSRLQPQGLARPVAEAALAADAAKLPAVLGVDLGEQGYVVAKVTQVLPRATPPGGDAPLQQQYAQAWSTAEAAAYIASLKKRYKAEIKESAVAEAAAASAPGP